MNSIGDMTSGLSQTAGSVCIKLDEVSKILSKIPDILTYTQNGKNIDTIPKINQEKFRLYLGQIFTNNRGLYSDDFIIGSIKSYLKQLENGKKLIIESASEVSWNINGFRSEDGALSPDEQIDYLNNIIGKYFSKDKDKIVVERISENHPELLSSIENHGIDELSSENNEVKLSSLEISKFLFRACQNNNKFFTRIASTNTNKKKGEKFDKADEKNYYALIEISIRLTDYINGVHIHGGESRQRIYDQIILDILNGGYDNIEEIKELKANFDDLSQEFSSLNFNKNKYKQELKRKEKSKKFWKKTGEIAGKTTLAVSIIFGSTVGGISWYKGKQNEELDDRINSVVLETLKNKSIHTYFKANVSNEYKTDSEKINFLKRTGEKLGKFFEGRYGKGNINNEELQLFFILEMIQLGKFPYLDDYTGNKSFVKFIEKVLESPRSKAILISNGFNVDNNFLKYDNRKEYFQNTYSYNTKGVTNIDNAGVNDLGEYINSKGSTYYIAKSGDFIVAKECETMCDYNMETGRKVSIDFLSSPVNSTILDIIMIGNSIGDNFFRLEDDIRKQIAELYTKGEFTIEDIKSWGAKEELAFLNKYFKNNIKLDLGSITQNTINLDKDTIKEISEKKDRIFTKKIGNYKVGRIEYTINVIKYNGKEYFYTDLGSHNYGEGIKLYGYDFSIRESKEFSKELINLL